MTAKHEKRAARTRNGEAVLAKGNFVNKPQNDARMPRKKICIICSVVLSREAHEVVWRPRISPREKAKSDSTPRSFAKSKSDSEERAREGEIGAVEDEGFRREKFS